MGKDEKGVLGITLEAATDFSGKTQGLPFKSLKTGDRLTIVTDVANYEVGVINPRNARVRVQGRKFRDPLRTHFIGSNISGGSLLAANTIVLYTFLEFSRDIMLPDRALRVLLNGVQVLPRDATLH